MLPRLNNQCDISNYSVNEYGLKTKILLASNVDCRIFTSTGTYTNGQGELITYDGSIHLNPEPTINMGDIITYDSKDYQVIYAGHTPDLAGNICKQFAYLKQIYVGV